MSLGENIYRLRTVRNMSQEELANALEVSRQSISKWETDTSTPELEKLIRLSQLFDISLDALVTGAEPEPPKPDAVTVAAPVSHNPSARKTVGIIILCFGLLLFLASLAINYLVGSTGMFFLSTPIIVIGFCCLVGTRKTLFVTGWVLCALGFLPLIALANGAVALRLYSFHAIVFLIMTFWSLLRLFSARCKLPLPCRIVIAVLLSGLLIIYLYLVVSAFLSMSGGPNIVTYQYVTTIYD